MSQPETIADTWYQREIEENICELQGNRNAHSKVVNGMDVTLTKQPAGFDFGLHESKLYAILTAIPATDSKLNWNCGCTAYV